MWLEYGAELGADILRIIVEGDIGLLDAGSAGFKWYEAGGVRLDDASKEEAKARWRERNQTEKEGCKGSARKRSDARPQQRAGWCKYCPDATPNDSAPNAAPTCMPIPIPAFMPICIPICGTPPINIACTPPSAESPAVGGAPKYSPSAEYPFIVVCGCTPLAAWCMGTGMGIVPALAGGVAGSSHPPDEDGDGGPNGRGASNANRPALPCLLRRHGELRGFLVIGVIVVVLIIGVAVGALVILLLEDDVKVFRLGMEDGGVCVEAHGGVELITLARREVLGTEERKEREGGTAERKGKAAAEDAEGKETPEKRIPRKEDENEAGEAKDNAPSSTPLPPASARSVCAARTRWRRAARTVATLHETEEEGEGHVNPSGMGIVERRLSYHPPGRGSAITPAIIPTAPAAIAPTGAPVLWVPWFALFTWVAGRAWARHRRAAMLWVDATDPGVRGRAVAGLYGDANRAP
ncbi:hypothetical protein B0H19DRAFT_1073630 [Mycena capillaripes]|nr:hypothetical protein B0H19DRAFT_1073630 [Mycena capillaripes]